MLRLSAMLGSRGTIQILTMPATWVGDFLQVLPGAAGDDERESEAAAG